MSFQKYFTSSLINALITIAICTVFTYLILTNLRHPIGEKNNVITFLMALSIGGSVSLAFFSSFYRGIISKKLNPLLSNLTGEIFLVQAFLTLLYCGDKIKPELFSIAFPILQAMGLYYYFKIALKGLNINHKIIQNTPTIAATFIIGTSFLLSPFKNFLEIDYLRLNISIFLTILTILVMVAIPLWFTLLPKYRLENTTIWSSFQFRLRTGLSTASPYLIALITMVLQLCAMLFVFQLISTEYKNYNWIYATLPNFLFFPAIFDLWSELDNIGTTQETLTSFSKLTTQSARTLLLRHKQDSHVWAATVGIKTSTFTVNHDPESFVSKKIPATLLSIRNEEIFNFVNQITKHQSLYSKTISQKIIGTIDPEHSIRPCVDVLNICATLYLDAGTLLERRLSGLVSLLPIVNPGLSGAINQETLLPLLKKAEWFFHFDYSWVDQSIFHTPSFARYGIHQDPVAEEAKLAMMEFMRKSYGVGNFVWIGKGAQERILQEAPNLANILEHHNLETINGNQIQVFSFKFEQLIPRLQRYYGLDSVRAKIIDFDPTVEAKRLLSIIELQIRKHKGESDLVRIIDSIASYSWKGFKEKDQALKLLLKISQSFNFDYSSNQILTSKLCESIKKIGYPSQLMNQAQIYKLAQRDITKLQANALNPKSTQFEEAWVIMSSLDYKRYSESEIDALRTIILSASKNSKIISREIAQARMIDSCVALIKKNLDTNFEKDINLLTTVVKALIRTNIRAETLTLAIDAFTYINHTTKQVITLPIEIVNFFESQDISNNDKDQPAWSLSLKSRWQEYRSSYVSSKGNPNKIAS